MDENEIGRIVVDTAIAMHRELGSGLLETVYEVILTRELKNRGLSVKRQQSIPIDYAGLKFDEGFRADIVVEGKVIVELKSVSLVTDMFRKQLHTYLKLSGMKLGLLFNFGSPLFKDGIVRIVNKL